MVIIGIKGNCYALTSVDYVPYSLYRKKRTSACIEYVTFNECVVQRLKVVTS